MKILQTKIRGLGSTISTGWLSLNPHLNLLSCPDDYTVTALPRILETLNPPFVCRELQPFSHFPSVVEMNGYTRKISPAKRTVSFAVFEAPPHLVGELGEISEVLYETDRIELGRKLDYSRWLNVVELASSTRWSEVKADFTQLRKSAPNPSAQLNNQLDRYIELLKPSDRIKNGIMGDLTSWLINRPPSTDSDHQYKISELLETVLRAKHFKTAFKYIYQRIPLTAVIGEVGSLTNLLAFASQKTGALRNKNSSMKRNFVESLNDQMALTQAGKTDFFLEIHEDNLALKTQQASTFLTTYNLPLYQQIEAGIRIAQALSRVLYETEPVLLFSSPERHLPPELHPKVQTLIDATAATSQCVYTFRKNNLFEGKNMELVTVTAQ